LYIFGKDFHIYNQDWSCILGCENHEKKIKSLAGLGPILALLTIGYVWCAGLVSLLFIAAPSKSGFFGLLNFIIYFTWLPLTVASYFRAILQGMTLYGVGHQCSVQVRVLFVSVGRPRSPLMNNFCNFVQFATDSNRHVLITAANVIAAAWKWIITVFGSASVSGTGIKLHFCYFSLVQYRVHCMVLSWYFDFLIFNFGFDWQ